MKAVILAGGLGVRLGTKASEVPKPMVNIGDKPILWHIMKLYSHYGIKEFIICLGHRGNYIKDYFLHYDYKNNDFTIDLNNKTVEFHNTHDENEWKVTLVDTGLNTLKGGRLKRIEKYLDNEINLLTYGDGISDINIHNLIEFHQKQGKVLTISGVHPPARFGEIGFKGNVVTNFQEKARSSQRIINGGFMVFNRELLNYLSEDEFCDLEHGALEELAAQGMMSVYKHDGLWACMDTEKDVEYLNDLWRSGKAFWEVWKGAQV
ncbi:glucose-1-phosphate cytidylyltransferase [Bacillus toyonensis]|uniref:glucose-1-phosphate cytidylyltransferase n=2 Tax=Bacillus cereus group TaxID=86661 RepID=UPI000BF6F5A9|nr:glucose-1-phosphate cytidylyltransferase [Bacillus toyonensis]PGD11794.1 glucose-1-phosphate cytidylyltransferase [Bacillus toyonensis]